MPLPVLEPLRPKAFKARPEIAPPTLQATVKEETRLPAAPPEERLEEPLEEPSEGGELEHSEEPALRSPARPMPSSSSVFLQEGSPRTESRMTVDAEEAIDESDRLRAERMEQRKRDFLRRFPVDSVAEDFFYKQTNNVAGEIMKKFNPRQRSQDDADFSSRLTAFCHVLLAKRERNEKALPARSRSRMRQERPLRERSKGPATGRERSSGRTPKRGRSAGRQPREENVEEAICNLEQEIKKISNVLCRDGFRAEWAKMPEASGQSVLDFCRTLQRGGPWKAAQSHFREQNRRIAQKETLQQQRPSSARVLENQQTGRRVRPTGEKRVARI